jgi:hypothetical protein
LITSLPFLLRVKNVSYKSCRGNQNTYFLCSANFFTPKSCRLRDNVEKIVEPDKPQMTIWRMRIACWITKATNTHSEYVILIAFLQQKWLRECASLLCYSYVYIGRIVHILIGCIVHIPICCIVHIPIGCIVHIPIGCIAHIPIGCIVQFLLVVLFTFLLVVLFTFLLVVLFTFLLVVLFTLLLVVLFTFLSLIKSGLYSSKTLFQYAVRISSVPPDKHSTAPCFGCPDQPSSGRCRLHKNKYEGRETSVYRIMKYS